MSAQADTNCHDIFNVVSVTRTHLAKIGAACHVVPTCRDMSATFPAKPQPKTPVHCDNATAVGIANNTIKRQRSRAMEMRYFWTSEMEAQDVYSFKWYPGQENLADITLGHTTLQS